MHTNLVEPLSNPLSLEEMEVLESYGMWENKKGQVSAALNLHPIGMLPEEPFTV